MTMTTAEKSHSSRVMPVVMPTVPMAEKTSKRMSVSSKSCAREMSSAPISARERFMNTMTPARRASSLEMRRPKISGSRLPTTPEARQTASTARVPVLTPPAVEPELPPMNMRMIVKSLLPGQSAAVSTLL